MRGSWQDLIQLREMRAIGSEHRINEGSASPGSAATDDIVPTPPSPCLNEIGDDDATPRQQWSPVHSLVRARTQPSTDYGSTSVVRRPSGDERGKGKRVESARGGGDHPSHYQHNLPHRETSHVGPDSPVSRVDLEGLDLSVLALGDESSLPGVGQADTFATGFKGCPAVIGGRPRSLGGRPSRSPALFVAPGHIGTGPSSPSSYSTHSESGFGSPARRLASPGPPREAGRVRKGHWKKGKAIGVGSCGDVYLGMNEDTGELMAVKEITLEAKERLLCSLYNEIQVGWIVSSHLFHVYSTFLDYSRMQPATC